MFDFDLTLRIIRYGDADFAAPEAKSVINACQAHNCRVAIASANENADKIKHVLGSKIDPTIFTSSFFGSSAFQYGNSDKSISISAIQMYYHVNPSCTVLFDDQWFNKQYADKKGSIFAKVDPSIGVAWREWEQADAQLRKNKCYQ